MACKLSPCKIPLGLDFFLPYVLLVKCCFIQSILFVL